MRFSQSDSEKRETLRSNELLQRLEILLPRQQLAKAEESRPLRCELLR